MLVLGELTLRFGSNALRGRIRRSQRRVLLLYIAKLAHEAIVLRIRLRRRVEHEVLVIRAIYLFAQPLGARGDLVMNVRQLWWVVGGECLVLGARFQVLGSRCSVLGSLWCAVLAARSRRHSSI